METHATSRHAIEDKELQNGLLSEKLVDGTAKEDTTSQSVPVLCSQRWIFSYLLFYFGFVLHVLRINVSLTLPYMVKPVAVHSSADNVVNTSHIAFESNLTFDNKECGREIQADQYNQVFSRNAEFTWSKLNQSMILAAYFWGFVVTQIPFGWVSGKYGGKKVVTVSMGLSSLLTLLTPVLARASPYALMFVRFMIGLMAGASVPSVYNLVGMWALPHERSRILGMLFFGDGIGIVVGILTSGILCDKGFDNGWGSVFYVHGICSAFFLILWVYCVAESPSLHPRITDAEKELIKSNHTDTSEKPPVPWRKLLTYVPVIVLFATHSIENFTYYLLFLCLPLFLKEVMKFDIQSNSLYTSLPFVTNIIGVCFAGVLADCLVSRKLLSISTIRKLFQCTGLLGMAAMLAIPGHLDCTQYIPVIVCLSTATLFEALGQTAGYGSNVVDIAPRFASVTFGISNTFASIPGMVAPLIVAELTPNDTITEWRTVFYIAAISALIGAVLFGFFSSSEVAPWARETPIEITVSVESNECKKLNNGNADECV